MVGSPRFALALLFVACVACGENVPGGDTSAAVPASRAPTTRAARDCGISGGSGVGAITPTGLGRLRVGATMSEIHDACEVVEDTVLPGPEGTQERRVTIALGADSAGLVVDGERVWRVEVSTPRFRTADSLGVGSRGWELKRGRGEIATGEGNVAAVRDDHCGLSFFVRGASPTASWRTLPDSAVVYRVLIYGCPQAPSPN